MQSVGSHHAFVLMIPRCPNLERPKPDPTVCRFQGCCRSGALRPKLASPVSRQGYGTLRALTYVPCTAMG